MPLFAPIARAIAQLDDPVFLGVVIRSLAWALAAFVGATALLLWAMEAAAAGHGWIGWAVGVAGGAGAVLLGFYFFLPVATVIALLFVDRVAAAVERRFYPFLPPSAPAPLGPQLWGGIALGLRVLLWQMLALVLSLVPLLAPVAAPLGWLMSAWAVGRGLFVAVAMRRMGRAQALALYRTRRLPALMQGGLMALGSIVPVVNLLVPVLGTAAMVHVLHDTATEGQLVV